MSFAYQRRYTGPVSAVIFDWAGTVIDYGSLAPIHAFCGLFEQQGVQITLAEARAPMGAEKREHIRQILAMPRVREAWTTQKGAAPTDADVDYLYNLFIPVQVAAIAQRSTLIPGAVDTIQFLNERQIKIGSNTGYAREMIGEMLQAAAQQGYEPQSTVCATEVSKGRPYPHMTLKNMMELDVEAVQSVVKVDDTLVGIEEGLNAGCWTVGVALSGNEVGLDWAAWQALSDTEKRPLRAHAYARFQASGAHYVIDTVADLPEVIADIEARLRRGETP